MEDDKSHAISDVDNNPVNGDKDLSITDKTDMSFLEHLEDLRGTLIRCLVTLFIACFFVLNGPQMSLRGSREPPTDPL